MLINKYSPKTIDEILGNHKETEFIKKWFINWFRGERGKPILITGPTGCGKTATALALAKQYHLELIEMNGSDFRDAESIKRKLGSSSISRSLFGNAKLILVDDVDIFGKEDRGGISELVKLLKETKIPIILTAIDIWDKKLAPIRQLCTIVKYRKPSKRSLLPLLKYINDKENLLIPENILEEIAENANGDIRAAINDLEKGAPSVRQVETSIFERLKIIFKSTSYLESKNAAWNMDHDLLKLWIDENIPYAYKDKNDLKNAYYYLSLSDIYDGRIRRRQYWGFLRYSNDFLTAGIALAKSKKYIHYVNYVFPSYLRSMSSTVNKRRMLKEIGKKIGSKLHINWKEAKEILYIIKSIIKKDFEAAFYYELNEEEVAFLLSKSLLEIRRKFKEKKEEETKRIFEEMKKESKEKAKKKEKKRKSKENKEEQKDNKNKKNQPSLSEFF